MDAYRVTKINKSLDAEIKHAAVVYLHEICNETIENICYYTLYAFGTVKGFIKKYQDLLEPAKEWFKDTISKIKKTAHGVIDASDVKRKQLYLLIDKKFDFCLFKVGLTTREMRERGKEYATHNPLTECIDRMSGVTNTTLKEAEAIFHSEIASRGYSFIISSISGTKTEWFKVNYSDPFYKELIEKGFLAFTCHEIMLHQHGPLIS